MFHCVSYWMGKQSGWLTYLWWIWQILSQCAKIGISSGCLLRGWSSWWWCLTWCTYMLCSYRDTILGAWRQTWNRNGIMKNVSHAHARLHHSQLMPAKCRTCDLLSKNARPHFTQFNIIHAHHVTMIWICWKPWYNCWWTCQIVGPQCWWSHVWCISANDHRTSGITRCTTILGYAAHTNSMWLQSEYHNYKYMKMETDGIAVQIILTLFESTPSTNALVLSLALTVTLSTPSTYTW